MPIQKIGSSSILKRLWNQRAKMKKKWSIIGIGIVCVALLGLWVEVRKPAVCENCSAKEQPFFQIFSTITLNDEARFKKFTSLASQTYLNFRVAVSADEARYPDVQNFINQFPDQFVKLPDGYQSSELIYRWIHSVPAGDIIVLFPSDGALDLSALEHLKNFYSGSAAWLAFQGDIKKWAQDGVLTGYANLFQKIKLQDFLEQGTFSENRTPENRLFELAGRHVRRLRGHFVDGKNYGYSWIARSSKPYPRYRSEEENLAPKTDLIVFSYDRPLQLYALLESVDIHVKHLDRISVIYRVSSAPYDEGYDRVKKRFPSVRYLKQGEHPESDFKPLVLKAALESPNPYIIFAVDDMVVRDTFDLWEGIEQMKKTGAFGVYYRLGRHINFSYMRNRPQAIPPSIRMEKGVYAWQFSAGEGDWQYPNTLDMTLYRKNDIKEMLASLDYKHPNSLESKWALKRKTSGVGIYYEMSKVINIPMNLVNLSDNRSASLYTTEELLAKFLEGLKLDIKPLQEYYNNSAHVDIPVSFVLQDETKL
jgi:hypothetical protein